MRPEAAGSRETRGRLCHCRGDDPGRPALPPGPESPIPAPWRPWMPPPGDAELTRTRSPCQPCGNQQTVGSKGAFGFQHPVRLYLPISKRQEYLQSSGEKVLASFPVQATIHFYNDESDSEEEQQEEEQQQEEEEQQQEEEEAHCNHHQCQEAEAWPIHPQCWETEGPGGKGRLGLASL